MKFEGKKPHRLPSVDERASLTWVLNKGIGSVWI
jgi:hypothetical protein